MKRSLYLLLLLPFFFACSKEKIKPSADTEILGGPPPPAICPEPIVTVSAYAGHGGNTNENGKLNVAGMGYARVIAPSTSGAVQYVGTQSRIRKIYGSDVTDLITLGDGVLSLAVDRLGNIYAGGYYTLSKVSPAGELLATWGRYGEPGADNGPVIRFHMITGLAIDAAGNIYIGEEGNRLVRKMLPDGTISNFAGRTGSAGGTNPLANGPALDAQFAWIKGIALNAAGTRLYVADELSVRVIEGGIVSRIAGGAYWPSDNGIVDGNGLDAKFNVIGGIAIDGAENLYVTDRAYVYPNQWLSTSYVRKIIKMQTGLIAWKVKTIAGGTIGYVNGVGSAAKFTYPMGLMVNSTATTGYVCDQSNHRVRKLSFTCAPVF